ncbi:MAG: hypothetical protein H0T17_03790, partial [Propionibacteriales bacterium]|nr:hypothetical protein [Propionibacteriales bacterium]
MISDGRRVDRRTVVKGVGLTALLGMSGTLLGCDDAPPSSDREQTGILDLTFVVKETYRLFALVTPGFEMIDETAPVLVQSLIRTDRGPVAPFAAIEMSVEAADDADVTAGLFSAGGDHVAVVFSPARQQVSVEVRRNGDTHVVARETVELRAPFEAAFAVCENQVTALVDTGDGWQPLLTSRDRVADLVDLRDPSTLAALSYGYGVTGAAGAVRLGRVKAGPFG